MSDLSRLSGVGPKREKLLQEAGIRTLRDLVYHIPRRYIDRTQFTSIGNLEVGKDAIFAAKVVSLAIIQTRMVLEVEDETGTVELVFFNGVQFLRNRFHEGQRLLIAGVPTFFRDLQFVHPEWEAIEEGQTLKGEVLSRYPLTEAMSLARMEHKFLQKVALEALDAFAFTDALSGSDRSDLKLLPETELLRLLHKLPAMEDLPGLRRQLKVRELYPLSLRLETLKRDRLKVGRAWPLSRDLRERLRKILPFELTPGQAAAVEDISAGQAEARQFCGLLQGDVGAGKTVVALLAAANVLEAGGQAALMAPTEILALQHHQTLAPWLAAAGVSCALLTGDTPKNEREALLADLETGRLSFLVGTHALYSADVRFRRLGQAVIDEQHRFGVQQRLALSTKADHPDILYMSATPIPRTLAHTVFGDLESFLLKDKPKGRLPVKTRLVAAGKRLDMLGFLLKEAMGGNQVFWVVPQIGKGEKANVGGTVNVNAPPDVRSGMREDALVTSSRAVRGRLPAEDPDIFRPEGGRPEEDIATLDQVKAELSGFSREWKVGAVHGRLPAEKKAEALGAFRRGEMHVLVATTVIEVGVDVPQANLMVIESPDRFGLAQLHQLRGRTGRGTQQAWCFLAIPEREWPPESLERISGFAETTDGFRIAEIDLRSRGAGNLEGADQAGYGTLRFTDLVEDFELTQEIRRFAEARVGGDRF